MLFAVASALVNCTNSYDYEEPDPKMVELAKYAKQHVPEQHPKVRAPLTRAPAAASRSSGFLTSVFTAVGLCREEGRPLPVPSAGDPLLS